jgi:hypothetical protein
MAESSEGLDVAAGDTELGASLDDVGADVKVDDAFSDMGMGGNLDAAVEEEESAVELSVSMEVDTRSSSVQLFDRSQLAELALLRTNA